ncbi:MAG: DUF4097 family beta strand repeat protein [Clostridia bacterium]|nr:DUF4097 family beta strand repeat protein [Clostridia bacterium]
MNKGMKIWMLAAGIALLLGIVILGGVMTVLKWDFTKLSTNQFETNVHEIKEDFRGISIAGETAHIVLVPSENEACSVVCYEQKNQKHSVEVEDGVLVIKSVDSRKWYEHIGISFSTPTVTVSVPSGKYGDLQIKSSTGRVEISKDFEFESIAISQSTGDVKCYASASGNLKIATDTGDVLAEHLSAGSLSLSVTTGRITASNIVCEGEVKLAVSTGRTKLSDLKCQALTSTGSTGDVSLRNVLAEGSLSIERSTGDVKFESCDAAEITVKTTTGDVSGTLRSEKLFIAKSNTGSVRVPESGNGGKCRITTNTGDVKMTLE